MKRIGILGNIILELILVSVIIFYWAVIKGHQGTLDIFSGHDGAGAFIACFGLLWGIGAFVRLSTGWGQWGLSLIFASCLVAFGYTLDSYGFFYALIVLGAWLLFLGYITGGIIPELAIILFIAGIILILVGFPFRKFSVPTDPEKRPKTSTTVISKTDLNKNFIVENNKKYAQQSYEIRT